MPRWLHRAYGKLWEIMLNVALSPNTRLSGGHTMTELHLHPASVAKYFLLKAAEEGEPITQLKLQKLVYLAYAHALASGCKLFDEPIQAWANGPVVQSLYQLLKGYGYNPIDQKFYLKDSDKIQKELEPALSILNDVFDEYAPKSAFELVTITHNDGAWSRARAGYKPTERCQESIKDEYILAAYAA